MITYTIPLPPRTKKNHQTIAGKGKICPMCGKYETEFIKQGKVYDDYAKKAMWYLRPRPKVPISKPVTVKFLFYLDADRLVDDLNLAAAADDLLVGAGILADDNRRIIVSHDGTRSYIDREHPRTEIYIEEAEI